MNLILRSVADGKEFELSKANMTIGRDSDCDMVLNDESLSRRHAELVQHDEQLLLTDLNSTNGTFVNNVRISKPMTIRPGDLIKFGACSFSVFSKNALEETIILRKTTALKSGNSFVVANDMKEDPNETVIQSEYPLPHGWPVDENQTKALFDAKPLKQEVAEIDRLIAQALAHSKEKYVAALVFRSVQLKPVVFGISAATKEHSWTIGRGKNCTLTIDSPSISETHAELIFKDNEWLLCDLDSTNGIRVNGVLQKQLNLKNGATVSFGEIDMVFRNKGLEFRFT